MRKIKIQIMSVLVGTLLVACFCSCGKDTAHYVESDSQSEVIDSEVEYETQESVKADIYVYVCGQVQNPGVYILPEGSRIFDAFALAGGLTAEAAIDYWNQARVLKDGEMLYVPTAEEVVNSNFETQNILQTETSDKSKVNINTASKEELMTIPGIGETRAQAILNYRQEHGPFTTIEDLKNVEGIKDGVFSKMKDYIVVN